MSLAIGAVVVRGTSPRRAWLTWAGVYLVALAAGFNQFKVPPVLPVLIEYFQLDYTAGGLLMGIFTLSGIVLSIPIGLLLQRWSLWVGILFSAATLLLGCLVGVLADASGLVLAGRVLEGVGLTVIAIAGQAIISAWFPDRRSGLPTGLFTSWLPASSLVAYLLAPTIALQLGWRGVWWLGAGLAALGVVAVLGLVRAPPAVPAPGTSPPPVRAPSRSVPTGTRDPWLLGAFYGAAQGSAVAFRTWFPTYLVVAGLASLQIASLLVSFWFVASVLANPVGGLLADRMRRRKVLYTFSLLLLAPVYVLVFHAPLPILLVLLALGGWLAALSPAPALTVAVRLPGQSPSVSIGILRTVNNVGLFVLPVACGWAYQVTGNGATVGYLAALVSLVGVGCGWLVREPA